MTETLTRKPKTSKVVKTISTEPVVVKKTVSSSTKKTVVTSNKSSLIPATKIKKVFDELVLNKSTISVINKIKKATKDNVDVTKVLTEEEQEVVGIYYKVNKDKFEEEKKKSQEKAIENGTVYKQLSLNEMSLRVYMGLKFKLKKDLTNYLSIICDLIVEEIVKSTIKSVGEGKKKLLDTKFILPENLSEELLYPLYSTLPSFKQLTELSSKLTNDEDNVVETVTDSDMSNEDNRLYDLFKGSIRKIFLKVDTNKELKTRKTYLEFLSRLVVEFLQRLENLLLIVVNNSSKNRVIIKDFGSTVIELIMSDFTLETSRYTELLTLINERRVD